MYVCTLLLTWSHLSCYFSWGSSLGKGLKYISISTTAYILVGMVCAQVIWIYLGTHMCYPVLPGVAHVLLYTRVYY